MCYHLLNNLAEVIGKTLRIEVCLVFLSITIRKGVIAFYQPLMHTFCPNHLEEYICMVRVCELCELIN